MYRKTDWFWMCFLCICIDIDLDPLFIYLLTPRSDTKLALGLTHWIFLPCLCIMCLLFTQLLNMFTVGYVRAKLSRTAALDHTNMACGVSKNTSKDCTFRVRPRYRVRSDGEHVCFCVVYALGLRLELSVSHTYTHTFSLLLSPSHSCSLSISLS